MKYPPPKFLIALSYLHGTLSPVDLREIKEEELRIKIKQCNDCDKYEPKEE